MSKKTKCVCLQCGKEFETPNAWIKKGAGKFCSRKCSDLSKVGIKHFNNKQVKLICSICGLEYKVKNYRKDKSKTCSNKCLAVYRGQLLQGENHHNWKGGISDRNRDAKKWAFDIVDRDKKCIKCGNTENLHAHHIKSFSEYPDLRYDINNGITLCKKCHAEEHKDLPLAFMMHESQRKAIKCEFCNKLFVSKRKNHKFCCVACRQKSQNKGLVDKICDICGKKYSVKKYRDKTSTCCSKMCAGEKGRRQRLLGVNNDKE